MDRGQKWQFENHKILLNPTVSFTVPWTIKERIQSERVATLCLNYGPQNWNGSDIQKPKSSK